MCRRVSDTPHQHHFRLALIGFHSFGLSFIGRLSLIAWVNLHICFEFIQCTILTSLSESERTNPLSSSSWWQANIRSSGREPGWLSSSSLENKTGRSSDEEQSLNKAGVRRYWLIVECSSTAEDDASIGDTWNMGKLKIITIQIWLRIGEMTAQLADSIGSAT